MRHLLSDVFGGLSAVFFVGLFGGGAVISAGEFLAASSFWAVAWAVLTILLATMVVVMLWMIGGSIRESAR